jgi:hypothetical protein
VDLDGLPRPRRLEQAPVSEVVDRMYSLLA